MAIRSRKLCRKELARIIRNNITSDVNRVYEHATISFNENVIMMVISAGSEYGEYTLSANSFNGGAYFYNVVVLVRRTLEPADEDTLDDVDASLVDIVEDNFTNNTYWNSLFYTGASDVDTITTPDNKHYWVETHTLRMEADDAS